MDKGNTRNFYQEKVSQQMNEAAGRLKDSLVPNNSLPKNIAQNVICTYSAAIFDNLTQWTRVAHNRARNNYARGAIYSSLENKIVYKYDSLLLDFVSESGAKIAEKHYQLVFAPVHDIYKLLSEEDNVINVSVVASLENASLVAIPYLKKLGHKLGCMLSPYIAIN